MWMAKYQSNYINTLTHRHACEIYINSNKFKQHDGFTNNMFEFSWNVASKIKCTQLGRIMKMLRRNIFKDKSKWP